MSKVAVKVAIVHDWLTGMRGGERCLEAFLALYPEADLHTLIHVAGTTTATIDSRVKETSFLQKFPKVRNYYRHLLPLYPAAISKFDFSEYDFVVSLSHAAAKNIRVPEGVAHFSYCFSPMRYVWDQAYNYFGLATPVLWPVLRLLRAWDLKASARPDCIIAISQFVAARIRCFYRREAEVIFPPVDTSWIKPIQSYEPGEAFLCAGAMVPYKKLDVAINAFNELGDELWIVGRGPEEQRLKRLAGSNIKFLGYLPDQELGKVYRRSRALVFPGTEDFGMIPVEIMAAGRPVIGVYDGGLKETVRGLKPWANSSVDIENATGVFFEKGRDPAEGLKAAVSVFKQYESNFSPRACTEQAKRFDLRRFVVDWSELLAKHGLADTRRELASQNEVQQQAI